MKLLAAIMFAVSLATCAMAPATAQECNTIEGMVQQAEEAGYVVSLTDYKGDEAAKLISVFVEEYGPTPSEVDRVTIATVDKGETFFVGFSLGNCYKFSARLDADELQPILDRAFPSTTDTQKKGINRG